MESNESLIIAGFTVSINIEDRSVMRAALRWVTKRYKWIRCKMEKRRVVHLVESAKLKKNCEG